MLFSPLRQLVHDFKHVSSSARGEMPVLVVLTHTPYTHAFLQQKKINKIIQIYLDMRATTDFSCRDDVSPT